MIVVYDAELVLHVGHCACDVLVNKIDLVLPLHAQGTVYWRGQEDYSVAPA